jgi:hypothetical protein
VTQPFVGKPDSAKVLGSTAPHLKARLRPLASDCAGRVWQSWSRDRSYWLLQPPISRRRPRSFGYFYLAVVVDVLCDLTEIAHVEPLPARRSFHVVVGLCPSYAVDVPTQFRHLQRL